MKPKLVERLIAILILALFLAVAPVAADAQGAPESKSVSKDETRAALRDMRKETLDRLYKEEPRARVSIRGAAGYAVFESAGAHILFLGGSGGRGIVRNNLTGKDTFMRMGAVRAGLGVGFEDVRTVLVFKDRDVLNQFLEKGWTFGGETAAVAKAEDAGVGRRETEAYKGIEIFQITQAGLAARGTVAGTKYWKDEELN